MGVSDHPSSDQDAIWDYYQNEGSDSFSGAQTRLKFLSRSFRPGQHVLNIGVGNGLLETEAQRLRATAYSVDPSERAILSLRERLHIGDRAQVGYSQKLPFSEAKFDVVVASEVLEHLDDQVLGQTLSEVQRVLKPGGAFVGTVPARERLADQTVICPDCRKRFHRWGHHQSFTVERMREMLARSFRVEQVYERYFAPWNQLNWKGRLVCSLKAVLSALGVHGSEENIVFKASKVPEPQTGNSVPAVGFGTDR
jgi:SAM-dependent methyltransferase